MITSKRFWLSCLIVVMTLASFVPMAMATERTGAWVDEVTMVKEPSPATAISRLLVGELDVYSDGIANPEDYQRILTSPELDYSMAYGLYNELTFNPVGPVWDNGELNPFALKPVREALNWLIDRDYIAQEIFGGMAVPKYMPITSAFPDYARAADVARQIELEYAPDPERAEAIIAAEMENLGAELVDGAWLYNGDPVVVKILARIEDERVAIADYLADLFEAMGFATEVDYKTGAEASPIWIGADPARGLFHIYTGAWITTLVARDQAGNFAFFYTDLGLASPLWQAYDPTEEFYDLAERLDRRDFANMEERGDMIAEALKLAMQDSQRVWLVDQISAFPRTADISIAADLAAGTTGARLWALTVRRGEEIGGRVNIGLQNILVDPWNPLGGSNWSFDQMAIRATQDVGSVPDPFTGLFHPQRVERGELTIKEGLPVGVTLDWVDLEFAEEIQVPEDAWIDWDAAAQEFITVADKLNLPAREFLNQAEARSWNVIDTEDGYTITANRKSVVYYPADLFDTVKWHDGSPLSMADFVMGMILGFDRGNPDSPYYDEAMASSLRSYLNSLRGIKITSTDPLVIEFYSDLYGLDAEEAVATFFPSYSFGPGAWHTLALGLAAEANGELAFSSNKAEKLEVEWLSYIAGPSLPILSKYANQAPIPYEPTLSQFLCEDEAEVRFANVRRWYASQRHFWVGTGPFYLERAYPVEGIVHLKRNPDFPDPADKWDIFGEPMIADVDLDGPARVSVGAEAVFDVWVTFNDAPYLMEHMGDVKYLLFNAEGEIAYVGDAVAVEDGLWQIALTAEITEALEVGANRIEVIAAPIVVSIPSFSNITFVTLP